MPKRSKSLLLIVLLTFSASALLLIKAHKVWKYFEPSNAEIILEQEISPQTKNEKNFAEQKLEIEEKAAELKALNDEIDDKIEVLRQAEENILRLIQQKEALAQQLPQNEDELPAEINQNNQEEKNGEQEMSETIVIELDDSDE